MNHPYRAHYLILLGPQEAPRALLFGSQRDYLTEMIDADGLMIDNLTQSGSPCAMPRDLKVDALIEPAQLADGAKVRCFSLVGAAA